MVTEIRSRQITIPPRVSEHDAQKAILEWLAYPASFTGATTAARWPRAQRQEMVRALLARSEAKDIFAMHKGVCYGIEVKAEKGRQSDAQKESKNWAALSKTFRRQNGFVLFWSCSGTQPTARITMNNVKFAAVMECPPFIAAERGEDDPFVRSIRES